MSKKSNNYMILAVLFVCVLTIVTALSTAMYNTVQMQKQAEQKNTQIKADLAKDKAEIISEVCVKGNHVVIFTVLKSYESNVQVYVDQAGYKENFSVVLGNCDE